MMTIDNDTVRRYIPNVICEVEGETPLVNKLRPFLESAELDLYRYIVGNLSDLPDAVEKMMTRYVVTTAFVSAIPSLDLVLTPSGFGVISTNSMAPASKDRVKRLLTSLQSAADVILVSLIHALHTIDAWRESPPGSAYCCTFYSDFDDVRERGGSGTLIARWQNLSGLALEFETALAERFIGRKLLDKLRDGYNSRQLSAAHPVISLILAAERRYIDKCEAGLCGTPQYLMWSLCRPIVAMVKLDTDLRAIWESEMGGLYSYSGFRNDVKGGFFF